MKKNKKPPTRSTIRLKVEGPARVVQDFVDHLDQSWNLVRTSQNLQNSQDDGIHVYLAILGRRDQ